MFAESYDLRVNPVNCVGVMSAGLAREFKHRYPEMFQEYKRRCYIRALVPGTIHIWANTTECVVNLPTKYHWRAGSTYLYVRKGLEALARYLRTLKPLRVAVPALGCGLGGLQWLEVSKLIEEVLGEVDHDIYLFEPR